MAHKQTPKKGFIESTQLLAIPIVILIQRTEPLDPSVGLHEDTRTRPH